MKEADLVLIHGKTLSVDLNGCVTRGEAVAVKDGIIINTGTNQQIKAHAGKNTKIIDCQGKSVLPGFCDGHCHASASASTYAGCDLFHVYQEVGESNQAVIDKYTARLRTYIEANPDLDVIRGTGWNRAWFNGANGEQRLPDRRDLDAIEEERPIVLESYCQHNIWVNTKAIELAGITKNTPDPSTGVIHREADGTPAGVFEEASAIELIKKNLPGYDYSVEQYKEVLLKYQRELANYYGVTLICDAFHTDHARQAYAQLAEEGRLTIRARGVYAIDNNRAQEDWKTALARKGRDNCGDLFQINTIKMFMEGEPCMVEPYEEEVNLASGRPKEYRGCIFWTLEEGSEYMRRAIEEGFQLHMHAMGDQSVKLSIDCLERAQKYSSGFNRNVIAHLMAVRKEDLQRIADLAIICSCQPRWMVYDTDVEDFYKPCFGEKRAADFYPNKSLVDAGAVVAYGTDFPVTPPPNPFHEVQCAVTRSVFPGAPDYIRFAGQVLGRGEGVSLIDAIQALTINGAYQNFLDDITGTIEIGKSAELVILDCDIETLPTDKLYDVRVETTIFKGEVTYEKVSSGIKAHPGTHCLL